MGKLLIPGFNIKAQPDEVTCGPTCLHALYQYYGDDISLQTVIREVKQLKSGGTLAVMLGNHALKRGYNATIYTYNLTVFDPTWFGRKPSEMIEQLKRQMRYKSKRRKLRVASKAYIAFLESGGQIKYHELNERLIKCHLKKSIPILTGLSATNLYETAREIPHLNTYNSIKGEPVGHFVILSGYDAERSCVYLADPMTPNPLGKEQVYTVSFSRLMNSILLGIVTYDANLLVIEPRATAP
jgi:hypothetical protein